mmetsp:Transcript_10273/g.30687  ORF Transcript_10273/g.30687 Transcript_10273/m.30687 type:complete len:331 (+) Transcript_10273:458-1450(+)
MRYTVFGGLFRTGLLYNVGEDAAFGGAAGDGVMHIPVDASELRTERNPNPVRLAVRAMEYMPGAKNDAIAIAEVAVNVAALVDAADEVTYPLTPPGKLASGGGGKAGATITLSARLVPYDAIFSASGSAPAKTHVLVLTCVGASRLRSDADGSGDVYVQAYRLAEGWRAGGALALREPRADASAAGGPARVPLRLRAPRRRAGHRRAVREEPHPLPDRRHGGPGRRRQGPVDDESDHGDPESATAHAGAAHSGVLLGVRAGAPREHALLQGRPPRRDGHQHDDGPLVVRAGREAPLRGAGDQPHGRARRLQAHAGAVPQEAGDDSPNPDP